MLECRDCPNSEALYGNKDNDTELWCDKVGGKISWYGSCEDTSSIQPKRQLQHSKKRNKRERDLKYKNHLKNLCNSYHGHCYFSGCICRDEVWRHGRYYYTRIYRGKRSKYLKKASSKKIRQYKGDISNGNACHKIFDFWWELY